jgi:NADH-quinone oxidoreductase subunit J
MRIAFWILACWIIASGSLAVIQRNIVHCALALIAFFAGVAGIFFLLRAEFLGAVQVMVYVGAVAVLILFAIMLTRHITGEEVSSPFSMGAAWGVIISAILAVFLFMSLHSDNLSSITAPATPRHLSVAEIGQALMSRYAVPFEVISLLLTAALIAAVVVAVEEPRNKTK